LARTKRLDESAHAKGRVELILIESRDESVRVEVKTNVEKS